MRRFCVRCVSGRRRRAPAAGSYRATRRFPTTWGWPCCSSSSPAFLRSCFSSGAAVATAAHPGRLFMLSVLLAFLFLIYRRNRPRVLSPDALPDELLPKTQTAKS